MSDIDLDFAVDAPEVSLEFEQQADAVPGFSLRDYQDACLADIDEAFRQGLSRILATLATGGGKTIIFSQVTAKTVNAGGRVLIIAHSEELLDQAHDKLERTTGIKADREKAAEHADLESMVVIASVQTMSKENRLTAFPPDHFALVICDEAHRSLAKMYQKVLWYFHAGEHTLADDFVPPVVGEKFPSFAKILGVTATADRGDKRSLGEFYERCVFDYGLLQACRDGYLVRPISVQVPLEIDLRKVKVSRSANGADFDVSELTQRITPFLKQIAKQVVAHAGDRKLVCFLPGVETARLLSEAITAEGMRCEFVSGACPDRADKIAWFNAAPAGNAICNAMLLTEGWDCPDVSAVCVLRPTKIRSLFVQCVGRGTRPLPGIIDGLKTRGERIAAIAASHKPDLRIVDFLWLSDRLDLVQPIDLVATTPQVREKMQSAGGKGDLLDLAEAADRDLLKSLEEAARKNSKKKARVIDPLKWAVSLGDEQLKDYEPQTKWEAAAVSKGQADLLQRNGIDASKVSCSGLASKLIDRVLTRHKLGLCTVKQLTFLAQLGVTDAALLKVDEANRTIGALLKMKGRR